MQALDAVMRVILASKSLALMHTHAASSPSGMGARLVGINFLAASNEKESLRYASFITNPQTRKVGQIAADGRVTLSFADSDAEDYAVLHATASVVHDEALRAQVWQSRFPPGSPQEDFAKNAFPGGPAGVNFLPISLTVTEIELIAHDLPDRSNAVADHPAGWKPLVLTWSPSGWIVKPDDGRVIVQSQTTAGDGD